MARPVRPQAQDDAELIGKEDRVNNEWIMDAVTHQPLGKQAAMKGNDGVFYWDLNVKQAITPGGVLPPQTQFVGDMRASYADWWEGMKEQWKIVADNNPTMATIKHPSAHLVRMTKPTNIKHWSRFTSKILIKALERINENKEAELDKGEVRLEIFSAHFNKQGLQKLGMIANADPSFVADHGLVLVKSLIPGDNPPEQLSEPYPLRKGVVTFKGRSHPRIERRYQTEHSPEERAELNEILEDVDPQRSEVTVELSLATKNGREMRGKDEKGNDVVKGVIGKTAISLKELLRDGTKTDGSDTCEERRHFELLGVVDVPDKKGPGAAAKPPPPEKKPKPPPTPPPLKRSGSLSRRSSTKIEPIQEPEEDDDDDDDEDDDDEKTKVTLVPIGTVYARIAIRAPEPPPKLPPGLKAPTGGADGGAGGGMAMGGLAQGLMGLSAARMGSDDDMDTPAAEPLPTFGEMPTVSPDFGAGVGGYGIGALPPLAPVPGIPTSGGAWPPDSGAQPPAPSMFPSMAGSESFQNLSGAPPPPAYPPPGMQPIGMAPPPPLMSLGTPAPVRAPPVLGEATVGPPPDAPPSPSASETRLHRPVPRQAPARAGWRRWAGPTPPTPPPSPPDDASTPASAPASAPTPPPPMTTPELAPRSAAPSRPAMSPPPPDTSGVSPPAGGISVSVAGSVAGDRRRKDDDDTRSVKSDRSRAKDDDSDAGSEAGDAAAAAKLSGGVKGNGQAGAALGLLAQTLAYTATMDTLCYTFAYWIKWKPMETLSDQLLFFGDTRNMPALIRSNKLGALVDNHFCATDFDPRLAGDNWCLLIITNDGTYSRFWIGYNSKDLKGAPQAARAQEPDAARPVTYVRTEMAADVKIRRLVTSTKGAGLLAQAWVWPRDLEENEIHELWVETKNRYPLWKPGITTYRPPPTGLKTKAASRGVTPKDRKGKPAAFAGLDLENAPVPDKVPDLPWDKYDPIIEKDNAAMLDIPLASKLAFQRLKNVFAVLVDYCRYSESFLVVDRISNGSPTAELMIEVALRANTGKNPTVLYMDSRPRLEKAYAMLKALIECKFLVDQEKAYKKTDSLEPQKLTDYKLTSTDYAGPKADLRFLVSAAGLAWLRASAMELDERERMIDEHPNHLGMCRKVRDIYREYGCLADLQPDKRPIIGRIWKVFYNAQLFASATHYIIFDQVELKAKTIISNLGTIGSIFVHGSSAEHRKLVNCVQDGSPILLLESTGGVTQAFSYVIKAVRLMKPKWHIESVLRLVTEYKQRAAKTVALNKDKLSKDKTKFVLDNIKLLDKELARIDLLLSAGEHSEPWMSNFGLPEMLMLFEIWQRSPDFLMKQCQTADVMKKDAEKLLDIFTGCFSSPGSPPELGLGNAQKKVVATAWNRHLILFNNAAIYNKRSWTMQFVLYFLGLVTTLLSILTTNYAPLGAIYLLEFTMILLPIVTALLGTISTRLRQQQK